jgi:hypothetical protein
MDDIIYRMLFLAGFNACVYGAIYLYGRKHHPEKALWLSLTSFLAITTLCYYSISWIGLSVILPLIYLAILRKPNQRKEFVEFFASNHIYSSNKYSQAALDVLGDKKWRFSEGKLTANSGAVIPYSFWQGSTSSMVSSGQYVRTTVHTYYIAFIFPPDSVTKLFKQHVLIAADKSKYTWKERIKFFFKHDIEKPNLVTTAADGSFIIQYFTTVDVEHYKERLEWIRNNITEKYILFPSRYSVTIKPS